MIGNKFLFITMLFLLCTILTCAQNIQSIESIQESNQLISKSIDSEENPIVWIQDGGLEGFQMETLNGNTFKAFQNIPFAQPPIGHLRFREPIRNLPWKGIRDAKSSISTCLQTDFFQRYNVTGTEDCLYLNVYTPNIPRANNEKVKLPVMVFIHGGGFFFGSSSHYGPTYMMQEPIVFVSMNYRLGPFGFLSTGDSASPGNNGLKDQVMALEWIQRNIEAFGGDPNRVTLVGESAGASSVQFHMISRLSKGLFHRGISESGCTFCFWSISEKLAQLTREYANLYGCSQEDSHELVNCLRGIDGSLLVKGQLKFIKWNMYPVVIFGPTVEPKFPGAFIDDLPANIYARGEAAHVPWITGFNSAEGSLNIASILMDPKSLPQMNDNWDEIGPILLELDDATQHPKRIAQSIRNFYLGDRNVSFETRMNTVQLFSDRYVIVCGIKSIEYHSRWTRQPVYAYHFNYKGMYSMVNLLGQKTEDWGVAHLDELIYLVNNSAYYPKLKHSDEDYEFSKLFVNIWANFARTGVPFLTNHDGTDSYIWESVTPGVRGQNIKYLELNLNPQMVLSPFSERLQFWQSLNLTEDEPDTDLIQQY